MAGMGSGYDLSVSTISPDGRVFQVEYASKAVDNAGTAMAMVCKDGVVLGVEKYQENKLLIPGTNRRLMPIDKHIGIAVAGMIPDARQIVKRARSEASSYKEHYGEPIPAKILAERIGLFVHAYTLYWSVRPFGASVIIASMDKGSPDATGEVYCVEPSGTAYKYLGMAIGRWKLAAKSKMEGLDFSTLTCKDAIFQICKILRQVQDQDKETALEIEISVISPDTDMQYKLLPKEEVYATDQEVQKYLSELEEE